MSVCGCLCVSRIDGSVCPLCQDPVSGEEWSGGGHRAQCGARNTAKLTTYPAHPDTPCPRCRGKLRLWPLTSPLAKFRCSAELGACVTSSTGSKIKSNGRNRYYCYPCDVCLCLGCVEKEAREREKQEKLVTCLQSLCDKVRDKVEEEERSIKEQQRLQSLELETEDIPLIDADNNMVITTAEPSPVPRRGTNILVRCGSSLSKHISLPIKTNSAPAPRPQEISPDVFELRAPLVSWESLVTSPTTDTLTMETGLRVRNMVEEDRQPVIRDSAEMEVKDKHNGSDKIGADNGAMEEENESEINICKSVEENDISFPHENGDKEEISDAESSKDSKDVQTSDSGQNMDIPEQDSDSFVSFKAQISAADEIVSEGGLALSSESNLDLLSLD